MSCDVGIVLGGGLNSDGSLPTHVVRRVDAAVERSHSFDMVLFSSRYTLNKQPVLDRAGMIVTEAAAMARHFENQCEFNGDIFLELFSTDTIGSGLATRSMIENLDLNPVSVSIITSNWHSERAKAVFDWAFGLEPKLTGLKRMAHISVDSPLGDGSRVQRERQSCIDFQESWGVITQKSHAWRKLHTVHDNYNLNNRSDFNASIDDFY